MDDRVSADLGLARKHNLKHGATLCVERLHDNRQMSGLAGSSGARFEAIPSTMNFPKAIGY